MALKSMTGYGKITEAHDDFDVTVEIKSVNGKYFDPSFRLPRILSGLEIALRNDLQKKLIRGKADVRIELVLKTALKSPRVNAALVREYKKALEALCAEAGIPADIRLDHYLKLPETVEFYSCDETERDISEKVIPAVLKCADLLDSMRKKEGEALEKDISARIEKLKNLLAHIEESSTEIFSYWMEKFKKRMAEIGLPENCDERIIQEAAVYGEKADVSEEITRLECHLEQFASIMTNEFPNGKKLDFLSQELHREFNTIASKSTRSSVISAVVEAKAEVDRIREQVQNLV